MRLFAVVAAAAAHLAGAADDVESVQRASLTALFDATLGRSGWKETGAWLSEATTCDWYGVTCDDSGEVTELNLFDNELRGDVSQEMWSLTKLRTVVLAANGRLRGTLSDGIGSLTVLETLVCVL
jgi:hypothetical protein